jgi:hypothetical protein
MNERFKELEKQATTVVEGWSDERGTTRYYEFNREKFAELIVRECAKAADEGMAQVTMRVEWPSYHIKKHFGVDV